MVRKPLAAGRAVCAAAAALVVASCQIPDFNQFQTPKLDINALVPPDPNQFARKQRMLQAVGPADLVDASGNCASAGAPAVASEPGSDTPQQAPASESQTAAPRGIGLEMTECEVVRIAGRPADVQISADERGDRTVVMVFPQPEKPTYRFVGGRLKVVERGAEPPEQPTGKRPAKKPAKRQAT